MKKNALKYSAVAAAVAAVIGAGVVANALDEKAAPRLPSERVRIETAQGAHDFTLEIAQTPVDQKIGLMYREKIADDGGMLFWFGAPAQPTSFWMKNTLVPLDMLFVGEGGEVLHVHREAKPLSLDPVPSVYPVVAVIELRGGRAGELGIEPGARVLHRFFP